RCASSACSIFPLSRSAASTWSIPGACCTTPAQCTRPCSARPRWWRRAACLPLRSITTPACAASGATRSAGTPPPRRGRKALRARLLLTGGDFRAFVANYQDQRGMELVHNVHDWMGGYPYESISAAEVEALMQRLGLVHVRSFTSPTTIGFFGSGCDEYVYRR